MPRGGVFGRRGLRWGILGLMACVAVASLTDNADARRRFRLRSDTGESYNPAYASIVVDVNSGAVMQSSNPDSPRHPASLTKIMTLYLLFERLEQGKITLNTDLPVSAHAAVQAPSKLGLKPGEIDPRRDRDPRDRHKIGQRCRRHGGRSARRRRGRASPR